MKNLTGGNAFRTPDVVELSKGMVQNSFAMTPWALTGISLSDGVTFIT